jgi:hypothetical protein
MVHIHVRCAAERSLHALLGDHKTVSAPGPCGGVEVEDQVKVKHAQE